MSKCSKVSVKDIDAVILCGGRGTRLKKITKSRPKPMIKIAKSPFLDFLINHLVKDGFRKFILCSGYKSQIIKSFFEINRKTGIKVKISQEYSPLGTGGAVKNASRLISSNPFIVLNGDSFLDCDFKKLIDFHKKNDSLITIALTHIPDGSGYGMVKISKNNRIIGFSRKYKRAKNCLINAGIYVMQNKVIELMNINGKFSLENDFLKQISKRKVFGFVSEGLFFDIGTPSRLKIAKQLLANFKERSA